MTTAHDRFAMRLGLLVLAATLLVALLPPATARAATPQDVARVESRLVDRVNAERAGRGLRPLVVSNDHQPVARRWSQHMRNAQRMFHNPQVASQVHPSLWLELGENVGAITQGATLPVNQLADLVHATWMNSPPHRANILSTKFTHIGIGADRAARNNQLWTTQIFMRERPDPGIATALAGNQNLWRGADVPDHVVLSRSDLYADALGGGSLAGKQGALLFTHGPRVDRPDPAILAPVLNEIRRILPAGKTVYLTGGELAIGRRVANDLRAAGYSVTRLGGDTRYETAALIAEEVVKLNGSPSQVAIATGRNWPDAISAGAWAAARGAPILLADRDTLPTAAETFLHRHNPARRWVVGGPDVMSPSLVRRVGGTHVWGNRREDTAVQVARQMFGRTTRGARDQYVVAFGWGGQPSFGFAAGLTGQAARRDAPLILSDTTALPAGTRSYLHKLGYTRTSPGTAAYAGVSSAVQAEVNRLLGR